MPKADGIEAIFAFMPQFVPWETWLQNPQPPSPIQVRGRLGGLLPGDAADFDDQAPLVPFFPLGFPVQPPQPPTLPYRKMFGALLPGDAADQDDQPPIINFFPLGFPIQPPQPPAKPSLSRAASFMIGDTTPSNVFSFVPVTVRVWEIATPPPQQWPRRQIAAGMMRGIDGTDAPFANFVNLGWPIASPMVRRPRWRSPDVGDSGIEAPVPVPFVGWESVLPNPAQRFSFKGGVLPADFLPFLFPLVSAAEWAFDATELIRPPRKISAAEMEPSFWPLPRFVPLGFDHQESPILRWRRPAFSIDETLIPVLAPLRWGFERGAEDARRHRLLLLLVADEPMALPPRPLGPGYEMIVPLLRRRGRAPLDRGYELVTNFPPRWTAGWGIQAALPPRPRPWRFGGLARGDDGTEQIRIVPHFDGWESSLLWPPHPRPEKSSAVMIGDLSGAWGEFVYLVPSEAIAEDFAVWIAVAYDIGEPPP